MQILLFTSPTCAPCRQLKPVLAKLQEEHKFKIRLIEASPATQEEFSRFAVRMAPTMIGIAENDRVVGMHTGFGGEARIIEVLRSWEFIK